MESDEIAAQKQFTEGSFSDNNYLLTQIVFVTLIMVASVLCNNWKLWYIRLRESYFCSGHAK